MRKLRFVFCFALFSITCGFAIGSEPTTIRDLLQQESEGKSVSRSRSNWSALNVNDRWQSGLLKVDNEWRSANDLGSQFKNKEYEQKRAEFSHRADRHLILARWCSRNNQPDRARAHYFSVLAQAPQNIEARKFLDHRLVGNQWVDKSEHMAAQELFNDSMAKLERWTPRLEKILAGLTSKKAKDITRAMRDLEKLDTIECLPALELFASNVDRDFALPLIRKITQQRSPSVCSALVRIGLANPNEKIQEKVADALREYPEHFYVPQLLSLLKSDTKVAAQLVMNPNGQISMRTFVSNELQNRKQLQRAQKVVQVVARFSSNSTIDFKSNTLGNISYWSNFFKVPESAPKNHGQLSTTSYGRTSSGGSKTYVPLDVALVTARNLGEEAKQLERTAHADNRLMNERMNRVCSLLRRTTGQELGDEAREWWAWWNSYNERLESYKRTVTSDFAQSATISVSSHNARNYDYEQTHDFGDMTLQYSCLVPGTLVQTETGLRAIELIEVGDLVLSKNVETGELALKPVILTTVRPPKETIKIVTTNDTINATGGHYWWVSGHGWCRSRELEPGMVLHTPDGTSIVKELELNKAKVRTHNLVVDGFNTYFVGKDRVLSYDNTLLRPTLRKVPGFELVSSKTN